MLTAPESRLERGSAVVETIFAIVILLVLALGAIEVAFALYARNVVAASAHEGARAALERGRTPQDAALVARRAVELSAGSLVVGLHVVTQVRRAGGESSVRVRVTGVMRTLGPVPVPIPLSSTATVTREVHVR